MSLSHFIHGQRQLGVLEKGQNMQGGEASLGDERVPENIFERLELLERHMKENDRHSTFLINESKINLSLMRLKTKRANLVMTIYLLEDSEDSRQEQLDDLSKDLHDLDRMIESLELSQANFPFREQKKKPINRDSAI